MLEGKSALVTGAAKGLGRATVEAFSAAGARVVAVDLAADPMRDLKSSGVEVVVGDVTKASDADRMVAAAGSDLNVLVNCAGIHDRLVLADEADDDHWRRVLDTNLTGPFLLCKRAIPIMQAGGGGVILNVASIAGLRGGRAGAAYTAAKHGLVGLTLNIAATLGGTGIRAAAVCPGGMLTGMSSGEEMSEAGATAIRGRDRRRPMPATAEQVASVLTFLATDAASQTNGTVIPVDGGATAY